MTLKKRYLVVCKVTIVGDGESSGKAMTTDLSLALPDTRPETITQALNDYVEQCWASKPHHITATHQIMHRGELFAAMEPDDVD